MDSDARSISGESKYQDMIQGINKNEFCYLERTQAMTASSAQAKAKCQLYAYFVPL
jgi:hypothetical protein